MLNKPTIKLNDRQILLFEKDCRNYRQEYGVATFTICPQIVNGEIVAVWIDPRQRPNEKNIYVVRGQFNELSVDNWVDIGGPLWGPPRISWFNWCEEHQCMSMQVSATKGSTGIFIEKLSTLMLCFVDESFANKREKESLKYNQMSLPLRMGTEQLIYQEKGGRK